MAAGERESGALASAPLWDFARFRAFLRRQPDLRCGKAAAEDVQPPGRVSALQVAAGFWPSAVV